MAEGGGGLGVLPGRPRPPLPRTARLLRGLALLRAVGVLDGARPLNPGGRGWAGREEGTPTGLTVLLTQACQAHSRGAPARRLLPPLQTSPHSHAVLRVP